MYTCVCIRNTWDDLHRRITLNCTDTFIQFRFILRLGEMIKVPIKLKLVWKICSQREGAKKPGTKVKEYGMFFSESRNWHKLEEDTRALVKKLV